jgi:hypothetical protein
LAQTFVKADLINFDIELYSPVLSYTFSTTIDGKVVEEYVEGQKITDKVKDIIKNLKSGDKVYFENIKATYEFDSLVREIGTRCLKIK